MEPQQSMTRGRAFGTFQSSLENQEQNRDYRYDRAKRFAQSRKSCAISRSGSEPAFVRSQQLQGFTYSSPSARSSRLEYRNGRPYSHNLQQSNTMSEDDAHLHPRGAKRPASPSDLLPNSSPKRKQIIHNEITGTENLSGNLEGPISHKTFTDLDTSGHEDDEEDVAQQLEAENRGKEQTGTPEQAQDLHEINRNQGGQPGTRSENGGALLPQSRQQSSSTENTQEQPHTLRRKSPCALNEEIQPQLYTSPLKAGMPQQASSEVPGSYLERGPRIAQHLRCSRSSENFRQNSSAQPVELYEHLSDELENGWIEVDASERGRNSAIGTKYTPCRTSRQFSEGSRTRSESRYRKGVVKQGRTGIQVPKVRTLGLHESDFETQGQDDLGYTRQSQAGNRQRSVRSQLAPGFGDVPFAFDNISNSDDETERPRMASRAVSRAASQALQQPVSHQQTPRSQLHTPLGTAQTEYRKVPLEYGRMPNSFHTPSSQHLVRGDFPAQLKSAMRTKGRQIPTISSRGVSIGPRSSAQSLDGFSEQRYYDPQYAQQSFHTPKRGRQLSAHTPVIQKHRTQSRQDSVRRNLRATSNISEDQPAGFAGFGHVTLIQRSTPHSQTPHGISRVGSFDARSRQVPRDLFTLKASRPGTPTGGSTFDPGSPVQAETPLQEVLRRKPQRLQEPHHETNATVHKATEVLFRKNIFGNISQSKVPKSLSVKPETPTRLPSGRGLIPNVIDLCTPESVKRPVPMKERLTPAPVYKKPSPVRKGRPKPVGAPNIPVKNAAKPKDQPIDSAAFRQQRAAETIVTKEIKGADEALDLAIFGEVIHDQAAEDKKAEEARLAGQLDREKKMAALVAKEEAARLAEKENLEKQQEEIAKRKLEKEKEEEKKRVKRIAERKKQEALELQEKEALRKKAAEKIRADRQKLAEEDKQKEIAKQKASRVEAQHLAQMEAKREAARKQAASLSASRLPPAVLNKPDNSGADELDDDFQSLFVGADDFAENPATSEAQSTPAKQSDVTMEQAVLNDDVEVFAQSNILSAYRVEREVEDAARAAERAKTKMNARYSARSQTSIPDPICPQRLQVADRPPSAPRPAPAKFSAPKPPPKLKAKPGPKSTAGVKAGSNPQLGGSLSFGTLPAPVQALLPPAQGLFENPIAKRWFAGLPDGFSVFGKTKAKPHGHVPREYKHKSKLISEIEREELEIAAKREKKAASARKKKGPTEEQKAEIRRKRAEQAREKQTRNIQDLADRSGIALSEEDLKKQVDDFMEQREKRIEKRNETRKLKESQAKANASNEGLGTQQAIPLDRSQPAAEVVYSDSETESEEDPDDEPETPPKSPTVTPEVEEPHDVDTDSGSESEDTEIGAVPPEKSAPDDTDHSIRQMIDNAAPVDDRLVFIYQVIKLETESRNGDKETQTHTSQMEGQFVSLGEANALVKLMVSKYREFHTRSLAEWFVGEKLHANIVFDAQHEIKLYIKAYTKASSLFPAATLAKLPVRFPAQSWIVMAYSERRTTNNGVLEVHHDSKRIQQFTVLQMANHAACAHLIELTRPKRPKMDDVVDHNHAAEQMRGARDSASEEGMGFEVEIEGDAAPWLEGTIRVAVERFDMVGPLN